MKVKGIIFEDFVNYKKPAMVIEFPYCDFKCDKECGQPVCQNSTLATEPNIEISMDKIIKAYLNNPITEAIVFQGLEPFCNMADVLGLIHGIRDIYHCNDDIVIYTGYNKNEHMCPALIQKRGWKNIIIKYGRFIPNQKSHYDSILGVKLTSDNQYAEVL